MEGRGGLQALKVERPDSKGLMIPMTNLIQEKSGLLASEDGTHEPKHTSDGCKRF